MKRLAAITLAVCLLFTGCGWMSGSYHSVTPHRQHSGGNDSQVVIAENYLQLRTALENMVSSGTESSVISVAKFHQDQLQDSGAQRDAEKNPHGSDLVKGGLGVLSVLGVVGSVSQWWLPPMRELIRRTRILKSIIARFFCFTIGIR